MSREAHVRICGGRRLKCRRLPGVVSDEETAREFASGGDREGERERTAVDVSRPIDGIKTGTSQ